MILRSFFVRVREWILPTDQAPGPIQLAILGAVVGTVAGLMVTLLHLGIDLCRNAFDDLPSTGLGLLGIPDSVLLCVVGGLLIGLLYQLCKPRHRHGGFVHIIERLTYHQAQFPLKNAVLQFVGTIFATATHQAVGREGASAHLGAATGSWLGARLGIPTSSLRILVACGAAAGISASFNTPLAAVIFIMEVIVVEYSVLSLAPGIVAAVMANAVAHVWLQSHAGLIATDQALVSYAELPYLAAMGAIIGGLATLHLRLAADMTTRMRAWPIWVAMTAVGLVTGAATMLDSHLAADGFDVINLALAGDLSLASAARIAALMLLCSALALAAGMPGGIIMPAMLIGASIGLLLGHLGASLATIDVASAGVYALLGLGAMIAAILQAPLTALVMIVELSSRTQILLPAMLVVVTAVLTTRSGRSATSVFTLVLRKRGLDYRNDPISQSLRRISVMAAMNRNIARCGRVLTLARAREFLSDHPDWFLVDPENGPRFALAASDLLRACNEIEAGSDTPQAEHEIDLAKIPGDRRQLASVHLRCSLQEAWDALHTHQVEALCVERATHRSQLTVYGVLTREAIENAYRT